MHLCHPKLNRARSGASRRGGVLGAVIVITLAITLLLAGLIKWVDVEARVSRRQLLTTKADYAAEAVCEHGLAQMRTQLDRSGTFAATLFTASGTPPTLPAPARIGSLLAPDTTALPDDVAPPPSPAFTVTPLALNVGRFTNAQQVTINVDEPRYAGDPLGGQRVTMREVRVLGAASVTDPASGASATGYCEARLQVRDAPLFGYAVFYNMDMEYTPGPAMSVFGPVHSNRNLYVQTRAGLRFNGIVTAARSIYHGLAPGDTVNRNDEGPVSFPNASGTAVPMLQGDLWVDCRLSDWAERASQLWEGNVMSSAHGTMTANPTSLPSYVPDNPTTAPDELENPAHVLIEPATPNTSADYPGSSIEVEKFASQACLVIEISTSGTPTIFKYSLDAAGTYVRNPGSGPRTYVRKQLAVPDGLIVGDTAAEKFYDARRAAWIHVADIDVGVLKTLIEDDGAAPQWSVVDTGTAFAPATEWNGVVYVEHKNSVSGAVRLVNGATVPDRPTVANGNAKGFTIATNVPAYILGNYNADGTVDSDNDLIRFPDSETEPPAAVIADAVTILSTKWKDANSTKSVSNRPAGKTEVAAAILTGMVPTNKNGDGTYSGGVNNLPRFLERWSGVKFGYRGSLVALFESEIATEPWGASNTFNPPDRAWGFNQLFANGTFPPGRLVSRSYRRIGFRLLTADQYATALAEVAP